MGTIILIPVWNTNANRRENENGFRDKIAICDLATTRYVRISYHHQPPQMASPPPSLEELGEGRKIILFAYSAHNAVLMEMLQLPRSNNKRPS